MKLRQKKILDIIRTSNGLGIKDIEEKLHAEGIEVSEVTVQRDLNELIEEGLITRSGKARATEYRPKGLSIGDTMFDIKEYFELPIDIRIPPTSFNMDVFSLFENDICNDEELHQISTITKQYNKRIRILNEEQMQKEVERLTVDLSWKSSEIEGNTYDLIDTEILIKENQFASGHSKEEAQMILNHKKAITYIFENRIFKDITVRKIEEIHRLLTGGLNIGFGMRTHAVRISGTNYRPLDNQYQIKEALEKAVASINAIQSPIGKALAAVLLISYIQPFGDGNKRTARILGNAILLSWEHSPLSYRSISKSEYKRAILIFYEQQSYANFKKIFIEQYKFAAEEYFVS